MNLNASINIRVDGKWLYFTYSGKAVQGCWMGPGECYYFLYIATLDLETWQWGKVASVGYAAVFSWMANGISYFAGGSKGEYRWGGDEIPPAQEVTRIDAAGERTTIATLPFVPKNGQRGDGVMYLSGGNAKVAVDLATGTVTPVDEFPAPQLVMPGPTSPSLPIGSQPPLEDDEKIIQSVYAGERILVLVERESGGFHVAEVIPARNP